MRQLRAAIDGAAFACPLEDTASENVDVGETAALYSSWELGRAVTTGTAFPVGHGEI